MESCDLPIFVRWQDLIYWLLPVLDKFPKKARFTFTNRIINLVLDTAEDLVEARYTTEKRSILRKCNLRLEKIRLLLRFCHELEYLSHSAYEHVMREINEIGKMLGGWLRQQGG